MVELTEITEKITRCVNSLNDICDEMSVGDVGVCRVYADKLNARKEEIESVKRNLAEISEYQE